MISMQDLTEEMSYRSVNSVSSPGARGQHSGSHIAANRYALKKKKKKKVNLSIVEWLLLSPDSGGRRRAAYLVSPHLGREMNGFSHSALI